MKAIVWTAYGPPSVLKLQEVDTPAPKENQVRVRIQATTVSAGDCEMRSLKFPLALALPMRLYAGPSRPQRITIIGQELAGQVESVGKDVTRFKEGDPVFAATGFGQGAYAEYICLPEKGGDGVLGPKPANLTYEEAAAVPVGGLNALHFIRKGHIQSGDRVLINGAGGSIGTIAIQLAKSLGAHVTAVDSGPKLEMLRSIGADQVVDYTREDFTKSGETYDLIFDVVGKALYSGCIGALNEGGLYLLGNPSLSSSIRGRWTSLTSSKKVIGGSASYRPQDLRFLKEEIEAGRVKPVIDRRYLLEEVAEAHTYVESGQKAGNVVVSVGPDSGLV